MNVRPRSPDAFGLMAADEVEDRIAHVRREVAAGHWVWDDMLALYLGSAWITLGLPSWEALCDDRLGMRNLPGCRWACGATWCHLNGHGVVTAA